MTEQELQQFQEDVAAILKRDYFPESDGYNIHTQLVRKNNNVKKYGISIGTNDSRVPQCNGEGLRSGSLRTA